MRPILRYPGGKWWVAQWILDNMPTHEGYVEPYFGSGAVFFNKPKSPREIINDLDGNVVNFFQVCRENPDELARALSLTPWSREEYQAAAAPTDDPVERARRFAIRYWMSYGSCPRPGTGWRHATGKRHHTGPDYPSQWQHLPDLVQQAADRLIAAQIEHKPALDVIADHNGPDVLIYADPPYLPDTRVSKALYPCEMTATDHEDMLRALVKHQGLVMLSGYDNDLYRDYLADWDMQTAKSHADGGAARTECLWSNRAAAERQQQQSLL